MQGIRENIADMHNYSQARIHSIIVLSAIIISALVLLVVREGWAWYTS